MNKPLRVVCLAVFAAWLLAGCWDRQELNDLAIAVGIGLDRNGKNVQFSAQIVNPAEVASKGTTAGYSPPIGVLHASEPTIAESIRKLTTISPRKIFSSHLRVLVIGEDLARQGIGPLMDGISRNHEFRSDFFIIVAKGARAEDVLEILTPIEKIPANKMYDMLKMSNRFWAPTVAVRLDQFISDISNPTKQAVLTGVRISGNTEKGKTEANLSKSIAYANLQYSGVALFKQDKLVDWLNDQESKGYNYIMGNVSQSLGHLTCPEGGVMAIEVDRTESKITGKVVDGKPEITVDLFAEENVGEIQCRIDLTKMESIAQLEKIGTEKLTAILQSTIRKAKKNKADIFGFGEAIEDVDPKAWLDLKEDWDRHFADMKVTVRVETQIRRLGTISNSMLERKE